MARTARDRSGAHVSPKPKPKSPPSKAKARPGGVSKAPARKAPARRTPAPPAKPRVPIGWAIAGGVVVVAVAVALVVAFAGGGSSSPSGSAAAPVSTDLVRTTTAANVPLLDQEGVATHTHTTLEVLVNGKKKVVPASIGIDA